MKSTTRSNRLPFVAWPLLCACFWIAGSSQAQTLEQHLVNLESALDQQVIAAADGHHDAESWRRLEERLMQARSSLISRDAEATDRVAELLRQLRRLEPRVDHPEILKRLHRSWKASVSDRSASPRRGLKIVDGILSGRVVQSLDGEPIESVSLFASATDESGFEFTSTDSDGYYSFSLQPGTYWVTAAHEIYADESYDNVPCESSCDGNDARTAVTVTAESETANIDFALDRNPILRGRITDRESGDGLSLAAAHFYDENGYLWDAVVASSDGSFEMSTLPPSSFYLLAAAPGYQSALFDGGAGIPCHDWDATIRTCDFEQAQLVTADWNQSLGDLDVALDVQGAIAGRVTDESTGQGLPFARVSFRNVVSTQPQSVQTDEQGRYQSPALPAGEYYVYTNNEDLYLDETYDNVVCETSLNSCAYGLGMTVTVEPSTTTESIDFALLLGGVISGTVTRAVDDAPWPDVSVVALDEQGNYFRGALTDASGDYLIPGLPTGSYKVRTSDSVVQNQVFDGLICPGGGTESCPVEEGETITVEADQTTSGIDFSLNRLGSLSGQLTDSATGEPISGVWVTATDSQTGISPQDFTDPEGIFHFTALPPGSYFVETDDPSERYLPEVYDDIPCDSDGCDYSLATPVEVRLNEATSGIDFDLIQGGTIQGRVTDRLSGLSIDLATVQIFNDQGQEVTRADVLSGFYKVIGLPPGEYFVKFPGSENFRGQIFDGIDCPLDGPCDALTGTPISVQANSVSEVDFPVEVLVCSSFYTSELCLGQGRFRIVGKWRTESGEESFIRFSRLFIDQQTGFSEDSAFFWFFDVFNIEGVIKILDACAFDRFWVFAAGLTNVEVTIWVTDLATLQTRVYNNPQGQAFVPVQDTNAFATCDVPFAPRSEGVDTSFPGSADVVSALEAGYAGLPALPVKTCAPASGIMCLGNGRFQVQGLFTAPGGTEQVAGTSTLSIDSGFLWFFDRSNIEVLVKVLDGCVLSERFWVFGAGLTNVETRIVVTDTFTGQTREYRNLGGNAFEPFQDTDAFATCF